MEEKHHPPVAKSMSLLPSQLGGPGFPRRHLTMREEIGFPSKTFLAWWNSSIFLLSEKNGGEKWFHDNLSLVNQFKVFLKTWIQVQIHDEAEEVRHLETTFSDCCPSSKINFIQVIIKLHKFILKYILSNVYLQ